MKFFKSTGSIFLTVSFIIFEPLEPPVTKIAFLRVSCLLSLQFITSFEMGLAEIVDEKELSPDILLEKILEVSENWKQIIKNCKDPEIDDSLASYRLYKLIKVYA